MATSGSAAAPACLGKTDLRYADKETPDGNSSFYFSIDSRPQAPDTIGVEDSILAQQAPAEFERLGH
jgi:hypothetical protein